MTSKATVYFNQNDIPLGKAFSRVRAMISRMVQDSYLQHRVSQFETPMLAKLMGKPADRILAEAELGPMSTVDAGRVDCFEGSFALFVGDRSAQRGYRSLRFMKLSAEGEYLIPNVQLTLRFDGAPEATSSARKAFGLASDLASISMEANGLGKQTIKMIAELLAAEYGASVLLDDGEQAFWYAPEQMTAVS